MFIWKCCDNFPFVDMFLLEHSVETACRLYRQKKDFNSVPDDPKDADYPRPLKQDRQNVGETMIREARREDIPACVNLIRSSFMTVADEYGITNENAPRFTAFAVSDDMLYWHMDREHRPMFVAEEDGVLCGYCSLLIRENGECELNHLAVLPQYRHRGMGKRLLEHSCTAAKSMGCRTMNIGIVEENTVLRKWYEQNGAIHIGTRKFDFFPFTCGYLKREL